MISKFSVKRPYTVFVGVILVVVLGIVSLSKMTADLLPNMTFPYVIVMTTDFGASPEEVEMNITAPLEATLATTSNLKNIRSVSYNSYSTVILEYEQSSNMDSTMIEIQQKIDQVKGSFPDTAGNPVLMQVNPDMIPIMVAAVAVEDMDKSEITDYVNNTIKPQLESVEGVASVSVSGGIEEKIEVTLNQKKIDELNAKIKLKIDDKFVEAEKKINDSKKELKDGKDALEEGKSALASQISEGATMLDTKKVELYTTESELKAQLSDLKMSVTAIELLISQLTSINTTVIETETKINQTAAQIENIEGMLEIYGISEEQFEQMSGMTIAEAKEQIERLKEERKAAEEKLAEITSSLSKNFTDALNEFGIELGDISNLSDAIVKLSELDVQMKLGIETINSALEQIESGKSTLDDAMQTLNESQILGTLKISEAASQIATGEMALTQAETEIDKQKKAAYEQADLNNVLTKDVLKQLITAQNFEMPAGYINSPDGKYMVKVGDRIGNMEELSNVVLIDLGLEGIDPIKMSDIADVKMTDDSDSVYASINGKPGMLLTFQKQTGYSTGNVTDAIQEKFESIKKSVDEKVSFAVLMDQGVYIDMIVKSIMQNMILGGLLAIAVLLLFLKDFRPTIIIACAIPLSVIFAIVLMYFGKITLNVISMSGLALGIGMLVDNSIVVIENIYRLLNEGMSIKKAAVYGAKEVAGAITASTLTTICVFAPIVFTEGITRQLFVDMGLTIAFTLTASLLVALTLVPAMASGLMKKTKEKKHPFFDRFLDKFAVVVDKALKHKAVVLITVIALLVLSGFFALKNGTAFMPKMTSTQVTITLKAPSGEKRAFEEMTADSDKLIQRICEFPEVDTVGAMIGGNSMMSGMSLGGSSSSGDNTITMYALLKENNGSSNDEIKEKFEEAAKDLNCEVDINTDMMDMSALYGSGVTVKILGRDIETLQKLAAETSVIVKNVPGTINVDDGLSNLTKTRTVRVDKDKAAKYGMTVAQVFQLIYKETATETAAATIKTEIKDYSVYISSDKDQKLDKDDLKDITFTYTDKITQKAEEIKLSEIATFEETDELSAINRDSQNRYISVTAEIDEDHNVGLVGEEINKALKKLNVPEGYKIEMAGEDQAINDAMEQLMLMLLLAVIFIYLIMVAQFQSLLSPFIIMFTIPLAFTGGLMLLWITGSEISVISLIGFVMISGIIVNNGIVLVDYINQLRREGWSKREAIIESSKTRLRPVLMTALTTIISMSTMAIGMGMGAEMAQPMAVVVVGGMIYGTLLTLVVVPCIYDIFMKEKDMRDENLDDDRFDKAKDELDKELDEDGVHDEFSDIKDPAVEKNKEQDNDQGKEKVIIQDAWGREMK